MKVKTRLAYVLLALAGVPALAMAETVTFGASEVNLGQGGMGSYRTGLSGNEWSPFGIELAGVSLYTSPFDPVDGVGIVGDTSPNPGVIMFLSPVSELSLQVLQAPNTTGLVRAYSPAGLLVDQRSVAAGGEPGLTTVDFAGIVGRVEFAPADFTAVTTLEFTSVPSPGGLGVASLGLLGLRRRRR